MFIGETYIPETKIGKVSRVMIDGQEVMPSTGDSKVLLVKPAEAHDWMMVPLVKSKRYEPMDHRYAAEVFMGAIESQINDPAILETFGNVEIDTAVEFNSRYDRMYVRAVPKIPYTLEGVKPFETELKTSYYESNDTDPTETFSPMITLTNDYDRKPTVSFGLYRWVCSNGMFSEKKLLNTIYFKHTDKDLKDTFKKQVNEFIMSIFENRLVEEMFNRMQEHEVEVDTFMKDVEENVGKRAVKHVDENFDITQKQITAWVAYNIVTWLLTHKIRDRARAMALMAKYSDRVMEL